MDILTFQSENPSGVDAFKGESHDRVAKAMHQYIKGKGNHRVIGLDGEFGSGKSSILQMLEKKILSDRAKAKLWIFDCEQNYQGSIKSNFIELFTEQVVSVLKEQKKDNKIEDVLRNRNIALGRHFSYTKDTRSHLSIWAILLIASGVFSPTFVRDYLSRLRDTVPLEAWQHVFYLVACLAPVVVLFLAFIANLSNKDKDGSKRWNISSLLKGSSDDKISETIEISKEVSPLDLKRALASHLHAVKETHFIIVIDNLDRLPRDVLRSVWSDLEIFTSVTGKENLSVIVPFCSTKVSKYLNGDGEQSYDSKDFIAKKFPVVFRTPPIITSGWKDAFRSLWSETFGAKSMAEADACSVLLQRHSPMAGGLVTPRLQKRFINDIATTLLVTADEPNVVCIAAYIAVCKYNGLSIDVLLKSPADVNDEGETLDEAKRKAIELATAIEKTKRTLKALFGEDMRNGWHIQILQIHFQTSSDIAVAELIDQPLADAIESQDGKKLASLVPYFGFLDSFIRYLEGDISPEDLFKTLNLASRVEGCNVAELLPKINEKYSDGIQLGSYSPDADYFESIRNLISLGLAKEIFSSSLDYAVENFEEINGESFDPESVTKYQKIISHYDNYLHALGEPFESLVLSSSEMLFQMILPDPDFKVIDVERISLNSSGLKDAVLQIAASEAYTFNMTPLDEELSREYLVSFFGKIKLAGTAAYSLNEEKASNVLAIIDQSPSEEKLWLAAAFFEKYTNAMHLLIQKHLPAAKSPYVKVAMAVIYIRLGLGEQLAQIPEIEKILKEYPEYFESIVRATVNMVQLYKLVLLPETSDLVSPVLVKLIKERATTIPASGTVYLRYAALTDRLEDWGLEESEFLEWFSNFDLNPDLMPELREIDSRILSHILSASNSKLLKLRGVLLEKSFGESIDSAGWLKIFTDVNMNEGAALLCMGESKLDFAGEKSAHQAISSYLLASIKQIPFSAPSEDVTKSIQKILVLFDKDARAILGTELRACVYDLSSSVESSLFILSEFGALLLSVTPRTPSEEERLLQVLSHIYSEPASTSRAAVFMNSRASQLGDWTISKEHKEPYASFITKLKDRMPRVYEDLSNKKGFKTKMKDLAKTLLGKG